MAAACLRALTILYLATISSLLPHLHHFQRSPKVLFFGCDYNSWPFVASTEPGFRVYLGVKTCEVFLCFVAIVRVRAIVLTSLFSLFYVTGEGHRFLHRG